MITYMMTYLHLTMTKNKLDTARKSNWQVYG